jgi:hypothetical protein
MTKKNLLLSKLAEEEEEKNEVEMSKGEFKKEHKSLVKVLKKGSKKQRLQEALKQGKELKKEE